MSAMPVPEPPTMRERYRAQVRGEVKQAALSQLAESGPAGLSVSAIGKAAWGLRARAVPRPSPAATSC